MKNKIFKKTAVVILAMMMILTSLMLLPLTASAAAPLVPPTVDGLSGKGTASEPYLVADVDDLADLILAARNEDGFGIQAGTVTYVKLTADISLPTDGSAKDYVFNADVYGVDNVANISWRIDGQNYTISNMKAPLFGSVGKTNAGVEIKNLKLSGDVVGTTGRYCGALVGASYGKLTIDNCHFSGSIRCTYGRDVNVVGGLVGLVSKFDFTIRNSSNSASVLNDCVISDYNATLMGYAGGIVGRIGHYTDAATIHHIIENCTNTGTVTLINTATLDTAAVGGIVGATSVNTSRSDIGYNALIKNCANTGTVTSNVTNAKIGGVLGLATTENSAHSINSYATMEIIGCTTNGSLAVYNKGTLPTVHTFDSASDDTCNIVGCNYIRHDYDHDCDTTCNISGCTQTRVVSHVYDNACDTTCNVVGCNLTRVISHTYDYACSSTCRICGGGERIPAAHSYGNWSPVNSATHKQTCACGHSVSAAHVYGDWVTVNASTHQKICTCGHTVTDSHAWDSGVVITPATHTTEGTRQYTCTDCRATKTASISKTPAHSYGDWVAANDTTHKQTCACSHFITEEHTFGAWEKADANSHFKTCVCGAEKLEYHAWDHGVVDWSTGKVVYSCYACGATDEVTASLPNSSNGNTDDTTKASETTASDTTSASESEQNITVVMPDLSGCSGALNSSYAILALVAVLGFVFVAKKKENE